MKLTPEYTPPLSEQNHRLINLTFIPFSILEKKESPYDQIIKTIHKNTHSYLYL